MRTVIAAIVCVWLDGRVIRRLERVIWDSYGWTLVTSTGCVYNGVTIREAVEQYHRGQV